MRVNKETIEHIANLARLSISETEKEKLSIEMGSIISDADKLKEIETFGVKPMEYVFPIQNVLREDVVAESLEQDKLLKNAPSHENGCYKVPKAVD